MGAKTTEKLVLDEIREASQHLKKALRGLSLGELVKLMRKQLGISQSTLAKRAKVPQSTISRIERGYRGNAISTLQKILYAMHSELLVIPFFTEPPDTIRRNQAKKIARKRASYLKGTMNLEEQKPDSRFIREHLKEEENRLLYDNNSKLWDE